MLFRRESVAREVTVVRKGCEPSLGINAYKSRSNFVVSSEIRVVMLIRNTNNN